MKSALWSIAVALLIVAGAIVYAARPRTWEYASYTYTGGSAVWEGAGRSISVRLPVDLLKQMNAPDPYAPPLDYFGAQGWEVVSESVPGSFLLKRPR